jgi:outer membrane protein OmpA-like peptidoglycan-associated protein
VDSNGCPIIKKEILNKADIQKPEDQEVNEVELSAGTNFGLGKSEILPTAYPQLNKIMVTMKKYPLSKWTIEGHTDNSGSNKQNIKISLERAQSVANYFVSKGILRNRFKVYGKGSKNPITSNKTEAGRIKNRRVVIKKID